LRTSRARAASDSARRSRSPSLYQSTGHWKRAVLVPALEGFSPTLEMPEIAEAQALTERLA